MSSRPTAASDPLSAPANVDDLIAGLRVPDVQTAALALATQTVPRQILDGDVIVGFCWATVDLERTISDAAVPFAAAGRDRVLGGSAALVHLGGLDLLIEEPNTEGRLAAFLARSGEGLCAVYAERAGGTLVPMRRAVATPLGRDAALMPHEWPWGPFLVAVAPTD